MIEAKQARDNAKAHNDANHARHMEVIEAKRKKVFLETAVWRASLAENVERVSQSGGNFVTMGLPPRGLDVTMTMLERIVFDPIRELGYEVVVTPGLSEVKVSW